VYEQYDMLYNVKKVPHLEEHIASIFRTEDQGNQETIKSRQEAKEVSCLAHSSILNIDPLCSSEISGFLQTTWHYDQEDHNLCKYFIEVNSFPFGNEIFTLLLMWISPIE
jgi:hypothetical protein